MSATNVYLLCEDGTNLLKIGVASCLRQRVAELQTGNPRHLKIVDSWLLPNRRRALEFEYRMHEDLDSTRVRGEWFSSDLTKTHEFLREEYRWFCRSIERGYI